MSRDTGGTQRISIDMTIRGFEHRSTDSIESVIRVLPFARREEIAFQALQLVTRTLTPFIPYVEVLKGQFHVDSCPQVFFTVTAVIVEPCTGEKFEVGASAAIAYGSDGESTPEQPQDVNERLRHLANNLSRSVSEAIRRRAKEVEKTVWEIGRFHAHAPGLAAYEIKDDSLG